MGRFSISPHIIVTHVQIFYLITFQNIPKDAGTFIYFSPHSLICGYILLAVISAIDLSNPNKMKSTEGVQWLPEPLSQPLCAFFNSLSKLIQDQLTSVLSQIFSLYYSQNHLFYCSFQLIPALWLQTSSRSSAYCFTKSFQKKSIFRCKTTMKVVLHNLHCQSNVGVMLLTSFEGVLGSLIQVSFTSAESQLILVVLPVYPR